jgi:hypothetical protein
MPKPTKSETSAKRVALTDKLVSETRHLSAEGRHVEALACAQRSFSAARSAKFVQLISETWILLLDAFARADLRDEQEYREHVEGGFAWAETTPEEIEVWIFSALTPHLAYFGMTRQIERGRLRAERAASYVEQNNTPDLAKLHATLNLDDLRNGRTIDFVALQAERTAIGEWKHDEGSQLLREAIRLWRVAKRDDRAAKLEATLDS